MLIPAQWFAHTLAASPERGLQARVPGHDAAGQGDGRSTSWASAWREAQAGHAGAGGTAAPPGVSMPAVPFVGETTWASRMPLAVRAAGAVMPGPEAVHVRASDAVEAPVPQLAVAGRRTVACAVPSTPRPGAVGRALPPPCVPPPDRSCAPHVHVEIAPAQVRLWLGLPVAWGGPGAAGSWLAGLRALVPAGASCVVVCNGSPIGTVFSAVPPPITEEIAPWN